jgi:CheY-like chemotaxis protein
MFQDLSENRRKDERRQLIDRRAPQPRRAGLERRTAERRVTIVPVTHERRTLLTRRGSERRTLPDRRVWTRRQSRRRRETPSPFTAEHAARIQKAYSTPGTRPTCPACGGAFTLCRARRRGTDIARQVRCLSCGRTAIVRNSRAARVMIVTPQEPVRQALRTILDAAGHEVLQAPDAAVGLWAYEEHGADVVIVDAHAPGRMGPGEFMRQLRRADPDARMIAMAARRSYGVADPLAMARQLGAAVSLRMPFTRDDVLAALAEARR